MSNMQLSIYIISNMQSSIYIIINMQLSTHNGSNIRVTLYTNGTSGGDPPHYLSYTLASKHLDFVLLREPVHRPGTSAATRMAGGIGTHLARVILCARIARVHLYQ
jgi:hypothetical protein